MSNKDQFSLSDLRRRFKRKSERFSRHNSRPEEMPQSTVNWKNFRNFAEQQESQDEDEQVVVMPEICYNKHQFEKQIIAKVKEEPLSPAKDADIEQLIQEVSNLTPVPRKKSKKTQRNSNLRQFRSFQSCAHESSNSFSAKNGFYVKVCSYNVLCEGIKQRCAHLYKEPQQKIDWNARRELLLDELKYLNADVYCLQEVQHDHFVDTFQPFFSQENFKSRYIRRDGLMPDGCAIAYKTDLFTELHYESIFYDYGVDGFDKNNVGQIIVLQEKKTGLIFLVTNTHILFDMKQGEIKTGQIALLLATVNKQMKTRGPNSNFVGSILCGSFNIDPNSPLYRFICEGNLQFSQFPRDVLALGPDKQLTGIYPCNQTFNVPRKVPLDPFTCQLLKNNRQKKRSAKTVRHDQRFLSAYRHYTKDSESEVSTRHKFERCPDFIFYSGHQPSAGPTQESRIMIRRRLVLPSLKIVDNTCGKMPNSQCGSDHLPLMAEFFVC